MARYEEIGIDLIRSIKKPHSEIIKRGLVLTDRIHQTTQREDS